QVEPAAMLLGEREADEAARVGREEVDRLGRHEVGGEHEVALVLEIFGIGEPHHAAAADLVDDLLGGCDGHVFAPGKRYFAAIGHVKLLACPRSTSTRST